MVDQKFRFEGADAGLRAGCGEWGYAAVLWGLEVKSGFYGVYVV